MKCDSSTYLFYLGHPAHYHNVSVVMKQMAAENCRIILVARAKDVLFDLLDDLPYNIIFLPPRKGKGKFSLVVEVLKRQLILLKIGLKYRPKIMIGTDIVITHIGKLLGVPSIILNEDDAEEVPYLVKYGYKYATKVMAPECCSVHPYEYKKIAYNGYHELAYLHPNYFTPDKSKVEHLFKNNQPYFILRFVELTAHHDKGKKGINMMLAKKLIEKLKPHGNIYITSERPLEDELEPYRVAVHPKDMHHVLSFATLFIGDSQTMTAEAAILGTPAIRFNDFVGKLSYLEELEHQYQLTFGITTDNENTLLAKVDELLNTDNLKQVFKERQQKMLRSTIDVAAFWKDYFMNFSSKN